MSARASSSLAVALLCLSLVAPPPPVHAQGSDPVSVLQGVGAYVQSYFARTQRIVGVETVSIQPLAPDFTNNGFPRTLRYDLRLDWAAAQDAPSGVQVLRDLLTVNGRAPRPRDEPQCLDPRAVTPEPLEFLLPEQQERFVFSAPVPGQMDGRRIVRFDYRGRAPEPVDVTWEDDCARIEIPGRTRGRVWVDAETHAVMRLDEGMIGQVNLDVPLQQQKPGAPRVMILERADTSIRYRPVRFDDPEETIFLPSAIDVLTIIRNAGVPRLRVRHEFANYRRFVTGGRIVN